VQSGLRELPHVWIEEKSFGEAFVRLLDNCVKYAFADPIAFTVSCVAEPSKAGFALKIRDYGVGIEPRDAEDIFAPGCRRPRPQNLLWGGQGMGLTLARRAIEKHGGSIRLTSFQYPTEITIWLPADLAHPPVATPAEREG